ncbi:membrane protein insertase YidC [Candidatus Protochlamydia phocaeensis]|uniref:membrane protein insertase YidC n=1 Tax=Candidatus Protochlamydia phocaeensis TaxID=1414722 RepID=UPI0008397A4D|nr:membrane protein insertase YidC [Candidatus Protochlamydia phocaeensis]
MDKRTILFVVALSLTLFGLNLFFQQQNAQTKQEWLAQQQAQKARQEERVKEEIGQRTANPDMLPLVKLYSDEQKQNFLAGGIADGDQILTLSWTDDLPSHIYALDSNDELIAYTLIYHQPGVGAPALYGASSKEAASMPIGHLPEFGRYDLQLVSFHPDARHPFGVTLGEYTDGHFSLPRHDLSFFNGHAKEHFPHYLAIALLKTNRGYLPVGLYEAEQQKFVRLQDTNGLAQYIQPIQTPSQPSNKKAEEKFYVLENAYQQFVFSSRGGALAEINLPFETKDNPQSVVREIEFDRDMVKNHPYNAYFPAHPYYTPSSSNSDSFTFHEQGKLGGYYPLLRRDLIEKPPFKSVKIPAQYYALNIVSEYPELAELNFDVKHFDERSITFEAVQNHRRITKTYSFGDSKEEAPYCLHLTIKIEGDGRGLWLTSGIPEVEWISGAPTPSLKYRITRNQKAEVEKIDLPKDALTVTSTYPDWICNSNGFLGMIMDPIKEVDPGYRVQFISGNAAPSRLVEIDEEYQRYKAADMPGYMTLLPLKSQGGTMTFRFFAGPFDSDILKAIDKKYSDPATGYNPDYIACQTMHGWFTFISEPFAKFLLVLMNFFHYITGSWALSIMLLTISLRLMLYPLNTWSTKSMIRMQQISPEVSALQEKYKKDPKKAQMEIMALYRERGVNPASGCLPLLIQMPFLIGMFDLLKSSFALRGASFIPGWIDDLTAPDVLFSWSRPIFFIGTEFHLLPILLGLVMFLQQRLMSTAPKDPKLMTDQQRQQRTMGTMMAAVFAVMFYNFPSGLNIYWLFSMLLGILQQWYTTKKMQARPTEAASPQPSKKARTK